MDAGALDRRLTIRRATRTQNALGETVETWADVATVWASKVDKATAEADARGSGEARAATITTHFAVRWSATTATVSALDRVVCAGRDFDVHGVREIGRREGLEIIAMARAE